MPSQRVRTIRRGRQDVAGAARVPGHTVLKRPRLIVADDETLFAEGLRKILETECDVLSTVGDGRALIREAMKSRPDIAIVDIGMPLLDGIEAVRQLRVRAPQMKFIFVTVHADPAFASEAFHAGASGYLLKRSAVTELMRAIRVVSRGGRHVSRELPSDADPIKKLTHRRPLGHLTQRQREVIQLVAEGRAGKEIADILRISPKTVEFHKSRIATQLQIRTTAGLTKYALAHGIILP